MMTTEPMRLITTGLGLFLFLVAAIFVMGCSSNGENLVISGRVEVDHVRIGSKIGGRVWKVLSEEGEKVEAGSPVVILEKAELEAELARVQASSDRAKAQLDLLLAGTREEEIRRAEAVVQANRAELDLRKKGFRDEEVREAEAQLASAKSNFDFAGKEFQRIQYLVDFQVLDKQKLDNVQTQYDTAQASVEIAENRLSIMRSGSRPEEIAMAEARLVESEALLESLRNGPRPEEISAARATHEASLADISRVETRFAETEILAPTDSIVETLDLEPGDLIKAGQAVAILNLNKNLWIRCYVPENKLSWVKPGTEVQIKVDSYPDEIFTGVVRRVASEAEFTPRNVQTSEKRVELVFEMKVDIEEAGDKFKSGMYADVIIERPVET